MKLRNILGSGFRLPLLERDLATVHDWLVDLRLAAATVVRADILALGVHRVDWEPHASGPEIEITLEIPATDGDLAERQARRRAERLGIRVLATRARRA